MGAPSVCGTCIVVVSKHDILGFHSGAYGDEPQAMKVPIPCLRL